MACVLGNKLNVATSLAVEQSLTKLELEEGTPVQFWGKIMGSTKDYLICVATKATDSISKKFFFSLDSGLSWALLPKADEFVKEKSALHKSLFTGNPSQIYKDPKPPKIGEDGEEEEEEEEEEEPEPEEEGEDGQPPKPKERKLNELERVAASVEEIDNATCIVPKGSSYLTPTSEIVKNSAFSGLSADAAKSLSSYLLYRNPTNPSTLACIRKDGATNNFSYLDQVGDGEPSGVWVVQTDASGINVSLRSLQFPGYEFNIKAGTWNFCGLYFGNGLKNDDVLFMI